MAGRILASVTTGVLFGTVVFFLLIPAVYLAALGLALAAGLLFLMMLQGDRRSLLVGLVVFLLAFSGAVLRGHQRLANQNQDSFTGLLGHEVVLSGRVIGTPTADADGQAATVLVTGQSGRRFSPPARLQIYSGIFPQLAYGDVLELSGEVEQPENFRTDTGRLFDYQNYLAKDDIFAVMYRPRVEILARDQGVFLHQVLANVRHYFSGQLAALLPADTAGLARGVLLGEQEALSTSLLEQFRTVGVVHVVVLSGFHVTVVVVAVLYLLKFLVRSPWAAGLGAVLVVVLFALLVGPTATVVRASIMAVIAIFSQTAGRTYAAKRALQLAVLLMIFFNPYILLYDPSFQLSVLATAGLVYCGDAVSARLSLVTQRLKIREVATATICAQIAVLPLLLFITGEVSVVSLLANLLVLPAVPAFMALTAATALTSPLGFLSFPLAALTDLFGSYIIMTVRWLAAVPFAAVSLGAVPLLLVGLLYLGLVALALTLRAHPTAGAVGEEN